LQTGESQSRECVTTLVYAVRMVMAEHGYLLGCAGLGPSHCVLDGGYRLTRAVVIAQVWPHSQVRGGELAEVSQV